MNESELLNLNVAQYRKVLISSEHEGGNKLRVDRLVRSLSEKQDWTESGARAIVSLAQQYGAFMLRHALALALASDKEDGDMGF
jgi:hypothetical protein